MEGVPLAAGHIARSRHRRQGSLVRQREDAGICRPNKQSARCKDGFLDNECLYSSRGSLPSHLWTETSSRHQGTAGSTVLLKIVKKALRAFFRVLNKVSPQTEDTESSLKPSLKGHVI